MENNDLNAKSVKSTIYRDGLTKEMVDEWKKEYGQVFILPYPDVTFIWRPIDRSLYKERVATRDNWLDREEEIAAACVLWPKDYDFINNKAGYAALLSEKILDESGFVASGPVMEL